MLPSLKKQSQQFQAPQIKLYNPPKQLINLENQNQRKASLVSSSRVNTKLRVMAGYKKGQTSYDNTKHSAQNMKYSGYENSKHQPYQNSSKYYENSNKQSMYQNQRQLLQNSLQQPNYTSLQQQSKPMSMALTMGMNNKMSSTKDLSAQIKLIEKKIRYHKKKLQEQKKKKQENQKKQNDPYSQDFQKIIKRQMELQGYNYQEQPKGFDYLTNPGKANQQQQPQIEILQQEIKIPIQPKRFNIDQKVQKLQKHYENSLKKKFERREMFPHYPCKRKTPKLYITQKTNGLQKFGKKPNKEQHMFRIMTKQCTPQQIYPTIPNFAIVKDSLSRNVMAYLGDYKPFIDKTKEEDNQQRDASQKQIQENSNPREQESQERNA